MENEIGTGRPMTINWEGSDNLQLNKSILEYSSDNGFSWNELYSKQLDGKSSKDNFTWLIPTDLKHSCQLKITFIEVFIFLSL